VLEERPVETDALNASPFEKDYLVVVPH